MPIDLPTPIFAQEAAAPVAEAAAKPLPTLAQDKLSLCLDAVRTDPTTALAIADAWLAETAGTAQVQPQQCLGVVYSRLLRWEAAEAAFVAGRDAAAASDKASRAQLGAMAGSAALTGSGPQAALALLDIALTDARAAGGTKLGGDIQIDRARALVALKRDTDAGTALTDARRTTPDNPFAWLLSATLSRRMNQFAAAQAQIQTAADLLPIDPEIGLEAGVIAMLSGREASARKSWESVVTVAPGSVFAETAKGYLAQLGPAAPAAAAPTAGR